MFVENKFLEIFERKHKELIGLHFLIAALSLS